MLLIPRKLEKVQWIRIPLQIDDPTRQVARLFPHPDIAIADQKLSFRTIAVISAYIISLVFSNSRKRSLLRRLPTIMNNWLDLHAHLWQTDMDRVRRRVYNTKILTYLITAPWSDVDLADIDVNKVGNKSRGVYRGGSGRNLRPVWLKGGGIPPSRGKNSPDIWVILMIVL